MEKFYVLLKGKKDVRVSQPFVESLEVMAEDELQAQEKAASYASLDGGYDLVITKVILDPQGSVTPGTDGCSSNTYQPLSPSAAAVQAPPTVSNEAMDYNSYGNNSDNSNTSSYFVSAEYVDPFETGYCVEENYQPYGQITMPVGITGDFDGDFFSTTVGNTTATAYIPYEPWKNTNNGSDKS